MSDYEKIGWGDIRFNGEEIEVHVGYPIGHVPIGWVLQENKKLEAQNAALRAELKEYNDLAAEYGIDGKTMLELAKSQIKTAKANCELMEELEQYKNTEMYGEPDCQEHETMQPCEYCRNVPSRYCAIRAHGFYQVAADDVDDPELEVNYCPVCGRRLEP